MKTSLFFETVPLLVLLSFVLVTLVIYSISVALNGHPKDSKAPKVQTWFVTRWLIEYWYWLLDPVARAAIKRNLNPDVITWLGLVLAVSSGVAFGAGHMGLGGLLIIVGGSLDIVDGLVARSSGKVTKHGAFLDSTLDRIADLAAFAGLIVYYRESYMIFPVILALGATYMVSYTRARGEGLGVNCKVGGMQRGERIFFLGVANLFSPLVVNLVEPGADRPVYHLTVVAVAVIALFGSVTAAMRGVAIYSALSSGVDQKQGDAKIVKLESREKVSGQGKAKTLK